MEVLVMAVGFYPRDMSRISGQIQTENWFPLLPGDDGDSIFPSLPDFCGVRTFMGVVLEVIHSAMKRGLKRKAFCISPVAQSNQPGVQRPHHNTCPCMWILYYPASCSGAFWHKRAMQISFSRCFCLVSDATYVLEAASGIQQAGSPSLWAQAVRKPIDCFVLCTWRNFRVKQKAQNLKKTLW